MNKTFEDVVSIVCDRLIRCVDCDKRGTKPNIEMACIDFVCLENDTRLIEVENCPLNRRADND